MPVWIWVLFGLLWAIAAVWIVLSIIKLGADDFDDFDDFGY